MEKKRNQAEFTCKLQSAMRKAGLDVLLLTKAESILYATGFASKFAYMMQKPGVSMAIVPAYGDITLIINDFEAGTAKIQAPDIQTATYSTWMYIHKEGVISTPKTSSDLRLDESFNLTIDAIRACSSCSHIGVESDYLTWTYRDKLLSALPDAIVLDGTYALMDSRRKKTDWEIEILRKATRIAEQTMRLTAEQFRPGMNSSDLLNCYSRNAFSLDTDVIDVFLAQGIGCNYSAVWIPNHIPAGKNDIVMLDGGVNLYGYHSDIARTYCLGTPTHTQQKLFDALYAGFEAGQAKIRPGTPLSEIFDAAQTAVKKNGIPLYSRGHVGHSIGLGISGFVEEAPFICPTESLVLEPGMVISFECPCYGEDGSFNLEDSFVITENGSERLSTVNDSLLWPLK